MKKTVFALSVLVAFGTAAYAGKKDIKSLKNLAIVKCASGNIEIGRRGENKVILNPQKMVNDIYDEVVKQFTAAGLTVVNSETMEKAAMEVRGEKTVEQKEADVKNQLQAMQSNPAMANLPPEVAAMMQQGMTGSMQNAKEMAQKKDDEEKARGDEIYEESPGGSGGGGSASPIAIQTKQISELSSIGDDFNRKNKNNTQAAKFFKALDHVGSDGYVLLEPQFSVEGAEAKVIIEAYFRNADGKKLYERRHTGGWKKTWGSSKIKSGRDNIFSDLKYNAEDAKTALQNAIPEAVQKLVEDLELK